MKTPLCLILLCAAVFLVGCGPSVDNKPPAAAMTPRTVAPSPPTPTTPEEKIAAIEKSSLPPEEKKKAIDRVRAGSL